MDCLINILVGLPASGKSSYVSRRTSYDKPIIEGFSYESLQLKGFKHFNQTTLKNNIFNIWKYEEFDENVKEIILDGLFLDTEYIDSIIKRFQDIGFSKFKITVFLPNIEQSLKNDRFRRYSRIADINGTLKNSMLSSAASIQKLKVPNEEIVKYCKLNNVLYESVETFKKKDIDIFYDWLGYKGFYHATVKSYQISDAPNIEDNLLCLVSYCCGGTEIDCYGDEYILTAEKEPLIKDIELVKILNKFVPLKDLEKIIYEYNQTFSIGDYYGGEQENRIFVVDKNKLFDMFKSYNKLDWFDKKYV